MMVARIVDGVVSYEDHLNQTLQRYMRGMRMVQLGRQEEITRNRTKMMRMCGIMFKITEIGHSDGICSVCVGWSLDDKRRCDEIGHL